MRALLLLLLSAGALSAQPDCILFFSFTAVGNSVSFDNRTRGCQDWTVAYTAQGFATLSLITQSAPDAGATPGAWVTFAGTVVNGINPNTSVIQATTRFTGYFPWMRVRLDATTGGPGTVVGVLYGWKIDAATSGSTSGTIATLGARTGADGEANTSGGVFQKNVGGAFAMFWPFRFNGATWDREFGCTSQAAFDITAGTTEIVALSGSTVIRICHLSVSWDATIDLNIVQGTGVNCGTGTADLTGTYQDITAIALDFEASQASLRSSAGSAVCLEQVGAANGGGVVVYAQY